MGFIKNIFSSSILELNSGDSIQTEVDGEQIEVRVQMSDDMPPDDYLEVVVEREDGRTGRAPARLFSSTEKVVKRALENSYPNEDKEEEVNEALKDAAEQLG